MLFVVVPAAAQTSNNIYQVLRSDSSFSKLVSMIYATHQDTSLMVAGPFTILAPTDEAFDKLPASSASAIKTNTFEQGRVMRNLMISGRYTTDQMVKMGSVSTLDGRRLAVTRASDGTVMIGGAKVVKPDIEARNGIIQGIDSVIMPS